MQSDNTFVVLNNYSIVVAHFWFLLHPWKGFAAADQVKGFTQDCFELEFSRAIKAPNLT